MKKLIGRDPGQVPVNGLLGKLAFLDSYGLIPLSVQTASNSAEINFTEITQRFDNYVIEANGIVLSTASYSLVARVYIAGSVLSSASYAYRLIERDTNSYDTGLAGEGVTEFVVIDNAQAAAEFEMKIRRPVSSLNKLLRWEGSRYKSSGTGVANLHQGVAGINTSGNITGIKFYSANGTTAAGNISSGTFTLYGVMKN